MDEDIDLTGHVGVSVMMSESITRLATAHAQITDEAERNTDNSLRICLQNMMPPPLTQNFSELMEVNAMTPTPQF